MRTVPFGVAGSTFTMTVNVTDAPDASAPAVHVTAPVLPTAGVVQVQPLGTVIDTNVVCAGSGSLTVTLAAVDGPPFETVSVYVRLVPASTGSGLSVLVIPRSAFLSTGVCVVLELLPGTLSGVALVAIAAVLSTVVPL